MNSHKRDSLSLMGLSLGVLLGAGILWRHGHPTGAHLYTPRWWKQIVPYLRDSRWILSTPVWAMPLVEHAARVSGVPPALIVAVVQTESAWRANAQSAVGAIGLMQLMPATARELGVDPTNPEQNLLGGSLYLRKMLERFQDVSLAVAAYNAGPGAVLKAGGIPPFAETQAYVQRILHSLNQ